MTEQQAIESELIQRELSNRQSNAQPYQQSQNNNQNPIMSAVGNYFQNAQPSFKLAVSQPQTFLGMPAVNKNGSPMMPNQLAQQTNQPWSDIYRNAAAKMPFAQSTSMAGQMVPEAIGGALDIGTRPATVLAGPMASKMGEIASALPAFRRFIQTQIPNIGKPLLDANPMAPIYKMVNGIQADITKPLPPNNTRLVEIGNNIVKAIHDTMDNFGQQYKSLIGNKPLTPQQVSATLPQEVAEKLGIDSSQVKTTSDLWQTRSDLSKTIGNPWAKSELLNKTNLKEAQVDGLMKNMKATVMNQMSESERNSLDILDNHFMSAQKSGNGILSHIYNSKTGEIKTGNLLDVFTKDKNSAEGKQALFDKFGYFNNNINTLTQSIKNHIAMQNIGKMAAQITGIGGATSAGLAGINYFMIQPAIKQMKEAVSGNTEPT